jgi:ABC-type antimicrobial peptide transport system permease subunit
MLRLVNQPQHHLAQTVEFSRQNIRRMIAGRHVRIGIALAAQFALQNIVGKAAEQLAGIRRAIADRIVERVFQE